MILTVNLGNTHITIGGYEHDDLKFCGRLHTDPAATVDEYGLRLLNLLSLHGASPEQIEGGILGSVVPALTGRVLAALQMLCPVRILTVGPGLKSGIRLRLDNPAQLGAELLCGAVAALAEGSGPLARNAFRERLQDNRIWFGTDGNSVPCIKRFLRELKFEGMAPTSILFYKEVGHSQEGAKEVTALFGDKGVFDGPKPIRLLQRLLTLANLDDNSIILDFFSGSASTAHAVMKMNAEKQKHCPFIMVQLPEHISEKKKEQGYKTVCEIGKERIRRAGKKIKEESPLTTQDLDTGFRVLKLDSTNMQDIYYSPKDISQADLFSQVDNVKPDRTGEDLLFQVMLELGATLDSKIETTTVAGKTIYNVAEGYLVACFDPDVTDDVVKSIAQMLPAYAVLRDTSMKDDSTATNFEQIFKTYSPDTVTKIL